jgi:hypothetical protein
LRGRTIIDPGNNELIVHQTHLDADTVICVDILGIERFVAHRISRFRNTFFRAPLSFFGAGRDPGKFDRLIYLRRHNRKMRFIQAVYHFLQKIVQLAVGSGFCDTRLVLGPDLPPIEAVKGLVEIVFSDRLPDFLKRVVPQLLFGGTPGGERGGRNR